MKRTTKMKLFRGMSLILCIIMMMQLTQLFVFAVGEDPPTAETNGEATPIENTLSENLFELGEGELPYAQLQELSPLDVALPETITRTQAIEKGHVNRLYAQEKTLQSVLYQNQNGTKTAYVFDKPVKYVRDGEVLDKDTTIRATGIAGYAYAMTENSFSAYFGSTSTNGVRIQYGDYVFTMKPESSMLVSTPTLGEDAKTVVYNGAFGAQTALRYETQLSGVKEDIILMRNVGKYSFNFLLTTTGLTPVQQENGGWVLMNAEEEIVINFGSIVIKDSAGKTVYGALNITPRASGGYIMTVTVPQAFLQAANTVYPVYVDPSTIVYEKSGSTEYIQDLGLYADNTSFMEGYLTPGKHFLNANTCKIVYRLLNFSDPQMDSALYDLTADQIELVNFRVRTYSAISGTTTISANPMSEEIYSDWSCYSDSSIFTSTNTLLENSNTTDADFSANAMINIDITEIAKGWARYKEGISNADYENPQNGFVLGTNSTSTLELASVEASGSTNVYYTVDYSSYYGVYYIKNVEFNNILKASDTHMLSCSDTTKNYQSSWLLNYRGDNKYLIQPMYQTDYTLYKDGTLQPLPSVITNDYYWYVNEDTAGVMFKNATTQTFLRFDGSLFSMSSLNSMTTATKSQIVWSLHRYNGFGNRDFSLIDDSKIKCMAYALMLDDTPENCFDRSIFGSVRRNLPYVDVDYSDETILHQGQAKQQFENWLLNYSDVDDFYMESDFNHNGEGSPLLNNQYRVVLRVGIHNIYYPNNNSVEKVADYHFWYQTKDGRWAHKNGIYAPVLLPYGVTPYTDNSGGWDLDGYTDFYDSEIYCYIITLS